MSGAEGNSDDSAQPVFLLSSERSGSNLLRSILNTHPDISAPHPIETAYPWQELATPASLGHKKRKKLVRDILINKRYSFHPLTVPLNPDRVANRVDRYHSPSYLTVQAALYEEACDAEGTAVWASKYPALWQCVDEALGYYENLKIIYLVRDARDVALSFKTSNIKLFHPFLSSRRWQEEQSKGIDFLERLGEKTIHLVQYEQLLQNPEGVSRELCEFLALPFERGMLYFYETEDAQEAAQSANVFKNLSVPIKRDNYGKFHDQLPEEEVLITEKVASKELEYFGYNLVHGEEELDAFELDSETYRKDDRRLERAARRRFWQESPYEQFRRHLSTSFTAYMLLRYGVFA